MIIKLDSFLKKDKVQIWTIIIKLDWFKFCISNAHNNIIF